jgi:transposase
VLRDTPNSTLIARMPFALACRISSVEAQANRRELAASANIAGGIRPVHNQGKFMNQIATVGADLVKAVIVVCATDREGRVLFYKQVSFNGFTQWAATIPPCTFGMEACSSAHHWGRRLAAHGHTVRLMAAEFVKPFRKSQGAKNDRNDAQAILTAVRQPDMRFVSVKSVDQQAMLAWHCMRRGWVDDRTALINRIRGLLAEFGVWLAQSPEALKRSLPQLLENEALPLRMRTLLDVAQEELRGL